MTDKQREQVTKASHFLERYDWLWSLPLSVFAYWFFPILFGGWLGMSIGSFDLSFIQPLFLAVTVVIGASTASIYVLRYHFKDIYRFIYSSKTDDEDLSSVASFRNLQPWQKFLVTGSLYFGYFAAVVIVYLWIL